MKRQFWQHKLAYGVLILGLILFITLYFLAWPNRQLQRMISLLLAVFYFIWGVFTHLKTKHIDTRVIWEYLGIAGLAAVLLLLLTF